VDGFGTDALQERGSAASRLRPRPCRSYG
jgi:hypothetical protein